MPAAQDDRLYLEAIERYASDEEFRARVTGIKNLIMRAENFTPTAASQVGMWIGAAVALHMSEGGIVEGRAGSPDGS